MKSLTENNPNPNSTSQANSNIEKNVAISLIGLIYGYSILSGIKELFSQEWGITLLISATFWAIVLVFAVTLEKEKRVARLAVFLGGLTFSVYYMFKTHTSGMAGVFYMLFSILVIIESILLFKEKSQEEKKFLENEISENEIKEA